MIEATDSDAQMRKFMVLAGFGLVMYWFFFSGKGARKLRMT